MNRQTLERLEANPAYKLTPKQIKELERLRALDKAPKTVRHRNHIPNHKTEVPTHPTEPEAFDVGQQR